MAQADVDAYKARLDAVLAEQRAKLEAGIAASRAKPTGTQRKFAGVEPQPAQKRPTFTKV
jgi:hypothetical protein